VEFGFDAAAGFANNLIGLNDVFNIRKTITINFDKISIADLLFSLQSDMNVFFNVHINSLSFGLFAGYEASGFFWASEDLLRFIKQGNDRTRSFDGSIKMGASAFLDAGILASFPIKRLRITAKPAVFAPLIYMPPPELAYRLDATGGSAKIALEAIDMNVYSAFSLENGLAGDINLSLPLGADLSVEAIYTLLPKLDLGLDIAHIPLVPAALPYRMHIASNNFDYDLDSIFGFMNGGGFELPDLPDMKTTYHRDDSKLVFRPLRLDFFVEYRPVELDLFVIRPSIGLSALTVYGLETVCFNAGVEGQINILQYFSLRLASAYREQIWRQSLSLMFNLRVIEINARFSLQGVDFLESFAARGLGISLGMRFGF
jgi:hypothetical protein